MVWHTDTESLKYRIGHPIIDLKPVALCEGFETPDTGLPVPGAHPKRIEVVYAIGDAKPPYKGSKPDAA